MSAENPSSSDHVSDPARTPGDGWVGEGGASHLGPATHTQSSSNDDNADESDDADESERDESDSTEAD